jgi:hypothetical protein
MWFGTWDSVSSQSIHQIAPGNSKERAAQPAFLIESRLDQVERTLRKNRASDPSLKRLIDLVPIGLESKANDVSFRPDPLVHPARGPPPGLF